MRALDRVIAILEAVAGSPDEGRPAQAALRTGLSLSTVSRVMRDMADSGLLERTEGGRYVLGRRLIGIARAGSDAHPLIVAAIPEMLNLRDVTGETVSLHVRAGDNRVCIAEIQSQQAVRRVVPVGLTVPLHLGATSSSILAFLPERDRHTVLRNLGLSSVDVERIERRLAPIREQRVTSAVDGWQEGVSGMGAPIFDASRVVAALSISGPSARLTIERMEGFKDVIRASADRISERITGV